MTRAERSHRCVPSVLREGSKETSTRVSQTPSLTGGIPLHLPLTFWGVLKAQRVTLGVRKLRAARTGHARPGRE